MMKNSARNTGTKEKGTMHICAPSPFVPVPPAMLLTMNLNELAQIATLLHIVRPLKALLWI